MRGILEELNLWCSKTLLVPDVLLQIAAVRGAIDKVARIVLDEHLTECVARAAKDGNIDAEMEELKAALDRFLP